VRASCVGVLWRRALAQQQPDGINNSFDTASAAATAPPGSMADAGSSRAQHPPAAWRTQADGQQAAAGPSDPSPESDDDKDGPEPVEYSPGGRYGRMDLVLGRGAFKTVRPTITLLPAWAPCCTCVSAQRMHMSRLQRSMQHVQARCWPAFAAIGP
jgi:hypothetical protein